MKGYKKKPMLIVILAVIYLLNPIGNILIIIFFNQHNTPIESIQLVFNSIAQGNMIAIVNFIIWLSAIPLAYGLLKVKEWAWYYFLGHSISILLINLIIQNNQNFSISFTPFFFINLIILIPIGFFISKEIRTPFLNPHLRWWEQATRLNHTMTIKIYSEEFQTYDISVTGAFIKVENEMPDFEIEEIVPIEIHLDEVTIKCNAEIIWINSETDNNYPKGIGIAFDKIEKKDKKKIKNFIKLLIEIGKSETR